jgi:hypothetical protein
MGLRVVPSRGDSVLLLVNFPALTPPQQQAAGDPGDVPGSRLSHPFGIASEPTKKASPRKLLCKQPKFALSEEKIAAAQDDSFSLVPWSADYFEKFWT